MGFLRQLFGPNQEEVWRRLAEETGSSFADGGFWRGSKVVVRVKDDEGWFGADFPEGVDELYFALPGVIKDVDRLKSLFQVFALILHLLCHLDSAYEDDPKILLA
jgi:hypothetical protein